MTRLQCGCAKNCLRHFDANDVEQMRLSMRELEKTEHDCMILGILESLRERSDENAHGKNRKRAHFAYRYDGVLICQGAFRHVYELSQKKT